MKTKVELITPDIARKYLAKNVANRPLVKARVEDFSNKLKTGFFLLTHQGIGFNERDELIDGQHRLMAIMESGVSAEMNVTRDMQDKHVIRGLDMFTMDACDCGSARKVSDQLALRHGITQNSVLVQAVIGAVVTCCLESQATFKMSVPLAVTVLEEYGKHIFYCVDNRSNLSGLRCASLVGSMAFIRKADQVMADEFYSQIVTGEALKKGDPAYTLRNLIINSAKTSGSSHRWYLVCAVCNAARYFAAKEPLNQMKHSALGIQHWASRQKTSVKRVSSMLNMQ